MNVGNIKRTARRKDQGPTGFVIRVATSQVKRILGALQKAHGRGSLDEETIHLGKIGGCPQS